MPNVSDIVRGHTELIILYRLLDRDSYGYEINRAVQEKTENKFELKEATLYTAFRRLEEDGCIESYWGDENTGARRRYYKITQKGRAYYQDGLSQWRMTKKMIDALTGETEDGEQRKAADAAQNKEKQEGQQ